MIRIALIEDDLLLLEALGRALTAEEGFEVVLQATSGEDALEFAHWEAADVALIDLRLPGLSGVDLIAALAGRHPRLRLLVCTVCADRETVFAALKAGASGYLLKQDLESETGVSAAVRQLMRDGAPLSSGAARWVLEDFVSRASVPVCDPLTAREVEILALLQQGRLYKEVAAQLHVSEHTIHAHVRKIHSKLRASGRHEALQRATALGYLAKPGS